MSEPLFTSCRLVHATAGRARFVYRARAAFKPEQLRLYLSLSLPVARVRINARARSLICYGEAGQFDAEQLGRQIAALEGGQLAEVSRGQAAALPPSAEAASARALPLLRSTFALLFSWALPPMLRAPLSLLAALPALGAGAEHLVRKGITSEVLEAMAIVISIARGDYLAANTTNFLVDLASVTEDTIARRSDTLLQSLLTVDVEKAWVERQGVELEVPVETVGVGDIVIAAAGATIPVDGTIIDGEALVNQVAMTGEALPVSKQRGDPAISGTVVEEGRLRIWAEQVGKATATYRIAEYVQTSMQAKSKMQLDASRLADSLVPVTLGLGGFTYLASRNWRRVAAVFQADYSCALKLATPIAFKSSMYTAGNDGILIKGADALERLAAADTFVFDKTGTLTSGDLEVVGIHSLDPGWSEQAVLSLAASIEEHYFHPIAAAVVRAAQACHECRHFNHSEVQFIVAHGVSAEVAGETVVIGSRHYLEEDEGISFAGQEGFIDTQYRQGNILLYIGHAGRLLGMITLRDALRPETPAALARLRTLGAGELVMLTGDHRERAAEMAGLLGLDRYYAELLPTEKAAIVERLQAGGHKVAFIGDGINDAPSLAAAQVGIAMQKGSDIARVTADIALLKDQLDAVVTSKAIANQAVTLVRNNYNITLGANTAILLGAAVGRLNPVMTSLLHNGTTIGILLNALRGIGVRVRA